MTESHANHRAELERRRDELTERLRRINADYRRGLDRGSDEQAVELENAEVLEEIARVAAEELAEVERALDRLDRG